MKKSIKLTLGLLGVSAISAITVGSVISCSNDSSMVSTNSNNSSNSNNTNKSSSTNPNSSNDTNFIPYSELTKTVTKEPSFAAALANWTNKWNQLTSNKETYLTLITNDFNACLSDTTQFFNAHSNSKDNQLMAIAGYNNLICSESYSNVQISLNKNNTFNISYDSICYIGYIKNKIAYPQVIKITSENNYTNLTLKPYIYYIPDMNYSGSLLTGGISSNMYAGEYITSGVYKYIPTVTILSKTYFSNAPKQTFPNWLENGNNKTINTTDNSPNAGQNFFPGNVAHIEIYIFNPYFPMLVSSYQNGMNFGELSVPNNN